MWIGFFCYPCKIGPVGDAPAIIGPGECEERRCEKCGKRMTAVWGPGPKPPKPPKEAEPAPEPVPDNVVPFRKAA